MNKFWIKAPNITTIHGFSMRYGGVSPAPFNSLNFGGSDDDIRNIEENRKRALAALRLLPENTACLKQVHGSGVCIAQAGVQTGDALVCNTPGINLAIGAADCYPIIFQDTRNHIIGAAHAGWRGTVAGIAANTIEHMLKVGAEKQYIQVAIGPGISCKNFPVGKEVINQFINAGFPYTCIQNDKIDLLAANIWVIKHCGIPPGNIWALNRCSTENDFFSYRRDKGLTGRMWAVIALTGL